MIDILYLFIIANIVLILLSPLKKINNIIQIGTSILFILSTVLLYFFNTALFLKQTIYFSLILWTSRLGGYIFEKTSTTQSTFNRAKTVVFTWIGASLIMWVPFGITLYFIRTEGDWFYFLISFGLWFMSLVLSVLTSKQSTKTKGIQYGAEIFAWGIIYFALIWKLSPLAAILGIIPFATLLGLFIISKMYSWIKRKKKEKKP